MRVPNHSPGGRLGIAASNSATLVTFGSAFELGDFLPLDTTQSLERVLSRMP
jgi:hypothetical protein